MSVTLSEHLPLLANAPNGIQKLRGLILELAIRGKLVPQDPNDEPASKLLHKIAQERARLEAESSLKKSKATAPDDAESPITSVAAGWNSVPMGEVVEIVRGITFPSSEKSRTPEVGRISCLRTANVQDQIEWDDILYIRSEFVSRADQMLRPNDIVMSMANSRELVGKVALVESHLDEPATFGGFLGVLRPYLILPRFVMAFLRAPTVRSSLIDSASQTTNIANISLAKLRPLPFPIPPLAEQHRIVAKIDELMSLCDRLEVEQADSASAHARLVETLLGTLTQSLDAADLTANWQRLAEHFDTLFATEVSIDALKQTVLQLAAMGKLVPQDTSDEPANELLKRIAKERARLEAEGFCKRSNAIPSAGVDEQPFDIPESWQWIQFAQLAPEYQNGESSRGAPTGSEIVVLRLADISNGAISMSSTRTVTLPESSIEKYRLLKNDMLIIRVNGSAEIVGRLILCDDDLVAIYCDHFIRARISDTSIVPRYLRLIGDAPVIRDQIQSLFITTAGQKTVNQGHIGGLKIPLPPLAEQHRVVAKVDELTALCDLLKTDLNKARLQQTRLATTLIETSLEAA